MPLPKEPSNVTNDTFINMNGVAGQVFFALVLFIGLFSRPLKAATLAALSATPGENSLDGSGKGHSKT